MYFARAQTQKQAHAQRERRGVSRVNVSGIGIQAPNECVRVRPCGVHR